MSVEDVDNYVQQNGVDDSASQLGAIKKYVSHSEAPPINLNSFEFKNGKLEPQFNDDIAFAYEEQFLSGNDMVLSQNPIQAMESEPNTPEQYIKQPEDADDLNMVGNMTPEEEESLAELYRELFGEDVIYMELSEYELMEGKGNYLMTEQRALEAAVLGDDGPPTGERKIPEEMPGKLPPQEMPNISPRDEPHIEPTKHEPMEDPSPPKEVPKQTPDKL